MSDVSQENYQFNLDRNANPLHIPVIENDLKDIAQEKSSSDYGFNKYNYEEMTGRFHEEIIKEAFGLNDSADPYNWRDLHDHIIKKAACLPLETTINLYDQYHEHPVFVKVNELAGEHAIGLSNRPHVLRRTLVFLGELGISS